MGGNIVFKLSLAAVLCNFLSGDQIFQHKHMGRGCYTQN